MGEPTPAVLCFNKEKERVYYGTQSNPIMPAGSSARYCCSLFCWWAASGRGPRGGRFGRRRCCNCSICIWGASAANSGQRCQGAHGVHSALFSSSVRQSLCTILSGRLAHFVSFVRAFSRQHPISFCKFSSSAMLSRHFLQGITGFGVPVAICAPLLIEIGVSPLWALAIAPLGEAWGNTFGTLSAAWDALAAQAGLTEAMPLYWQSALWTASFLFAMNLVSGLLVCWFYGRGAALRRGLPAVLVLSLVQGRRGTADESGQYHTLLLYSLLSGFGGIASFGAASTLQYTVGAGKQPCHGAVARNAFCRNRRRRAWGSCTPFPLTLS